MACGSRWGNCRLSKLRCIRPQGIKSQSPDVSDVASSTGAKTHALTCVFRTGTKFWAWSDGIGAGFTDSFGQAVKSQLSKTYTFASTPHYRCQGLIPEATAVRQAAITISNITVCSNLITNRPSTFINSSCPEKGYTSASKTTKLMGTFTGLDKTKKQISIKDATGTIVKGSITSKQVEAIDRIETGMPMILLRRASNTYAIASECYRIGNSACGGSDNAPCPSDSRRVYYKCVDDDGSETFNDACEADGCSLPTHQ
jgi:hypothetical protein